MIVSILILATIAISVIFGMQRGVKATAFALAGWVILFVLSYLLFPVALNLLSGSDFFAYEYPVPQIFTFTILFIVLIIILKGLELMIFKNKLTKAKTPTDKVVGGIFGALRGVLIVFVLILFVPAFCYLVGDAVLLTIANSVETAPLAEFFMKFNFLDGLFSKI